MDNPKKAAQKLLQFYQGEKLQELLEYLGEGINQNRNSHGLEKNASQSENSSAKNAQDIELRDDQNKKDFVSSNRLDKADNVSIKSLSAQETSETNSSFKAPLTLPELAERLNRRPRTIRGKINEGLNEFVKWTREKDPDDIAWQRNEQKKRGLYLFSPVEELKEEEVD